MPTVPYENPPTRSSSDELWYMQSESLLSNLPGLFWGLDATNISAAAIMVEDFLPASSTLEDLQGSAIVSNLICFLTQCGDLLHDLYSCIAFTQGGSEAKNVVNACVQRLKNDYACQNASTGGILSIVERFVALGYLQTTEELRKYMSDGPQAVILEDEALAEFCQTVRETTATVSSPLTPPRGGDRRLSELGLIPRRVIPCEVCGRLFSRTYNKNRHIETKHPRSQLSPSANGLVQGSVRVTA
ncbi:hypothetical protein LB503_007928 [Fusarium chuoi]|nr:hypothetical protein LB503_007928 [Fusarium chuoi]